MATYAVGDLQGCFDALQSLLATIGFDPPRDRLWLTGDLVNRGPQSLETLRFVRALGDNAVVVLGNHDLHLLALGYGATSPRSCDTLSDVLCAPDRGELLDWLKRRPLLHRDPVLGFTMVHAGILPAWSEATAARLAREVETELGRASEASFFKSLYGNIPDHWDDRLSGHERRRVIVNALTRMRYCDKWGRMDFREKGAPGTQAAGLRPWFDFGPPRRTRILFGHWSTLRAPVPDGFHGLDHGCVWGNALTALRLDDLQFFSVKCRRYAARAE
ncbi:MAG: symmetrical bis(5'-nucleosyl)-tetraphosphatase [Acidiferrobacteraceae bacterium]